MSRFWVFAALAAGLAGCATGMCDSCPTVAFTANGETDLVVDVGTQIEYVWSSSNADSATSTATMTPSPDPCGNTTGPWVVDTVEGAREPEPILPCQSGVTYQLVVEVVQATTGERETASVAIAVR